MSALGVSLWVRNKNLPQSEFGNYAVSIVSRRYQLYALQGPSQSAKTSFIESLYRNPFVVTVQGITTLNLSTFEYGVRDALCLGRTVLVARAVEVP